MQKKEYRISGCDFSDLNGFYDQISKVLIPNVSWGQNLDAFNDILRGGFGTPDEGFVLIWRNADVSRRQLGYDETVKELEKKLARCHPDNRESVAEELERAKERRGDTVFDWLIEILKTHCPGGREEQDGVELVLD